MVLLVLLSMVQIFSTNNTNGPFIYGGSSAGLNALEEVAYKETGVVVKYGMGILSKTIRVLKNVMESHRVVL